MNPSLRQQQTIAAATSIQGTGYWSGQLVTVEFRPAPPHTGIVFVRRDLVPVRRIKAVSEHCIQTRRRTTLTANGGTVEMVEHIMAALHGLQIDNCEVYVNAAEMPAGDGSSLEATKALLSVGVVSQEALRSALEIRHPIRVGDEHAWIEARPSQQAGLSIWYHLDYGADNPIGDQVFETVISPDRFQTELASARTFLLEEEARQMQLSGIGSSVTYDDILVFGKNGPLHNRLRFSDECVRHKVLDIVGDLALAGFEIHGHIRAHRSGHRLNGQLVNALHAERGSIVRHSA